jgi:polyhydroxybutyrate depolymerase
MMSYWLAMKMPERFAAVAPVMATMPALNLDEAPPAEPVPILMIHGTDDPVLPYEGGRFLGLPDLPSILPLGEDRTVLRFLSAPETVAYWCIQNGVDPVPTTIELPNLDLEDGATGLLSVYGGSSNGAEVFFCEIVGGGHTWPGGPQYLSPILIGNTCRDFHAAEMIWAFFQRHTLDGE